nr:hypothetical protein [Desulfovibrio sp. MES5]
MDKHRRCGLGHFSFEKRLGSLTLHEVQRAAARVDSAENRNFRQNDKLKCEEPQRQSDLLTEAQGMLADIFGVKAKGAFFLSFGNKQGDAGPVDHFHKGQVFFLNGICSVNAGMQVKGKSIGGLACPFLYVAGGLSECGDQVFMARKRQNSCKGITCDVAAAGKRATAVFFKYARNAPQLFVARFDSLHLIVKLEIFYICQPNGKDRIRIFLQKFCCFQLQTMAVDAAGYGVNKSQLLQLSVAPLGQPVYAPGQEEKADQRQNGDNAPTIQQQRGDEVQRVQRNRAEKKPVVVLDWVKRSKVLFISGMIQKIMSVTPGQLVQGLMVVGLIICPRSKMLSTPLAGPRSEDRMKRPCASISPAKPLALKRGVLRIFKKTSALLTPISTWLT